MSLWIVGRCRGLVGDGPLGRCLDAEAYETAKGVIKGRRRKEEKKKRKKERVKRSGKQVFLFVAPGRMNAW
jgi:3'-phosphoadenosine 5'-phosphosulfate sulfotransferase (PAPS reductase)/FAD synthetase